MNKVFGNFNIKVGDLLVANQDLYNSKGFKKGAVFTVYKIERDYLYINIPDTEYYTYFDIESQNAELCSLAVKENRERQLKSILD